jgi:hypothetical protein
MLQRTFHGFLTLTGIGLMVGGLIARVNGAVVIGLIIAGVNANQWLKLAQPARP